ncbi:MAG: Stp1/IreP family PP2C-type Ser/Thr phosphatase [Proteobacteria bacterium]|nr:Stp1/IreP family PP2C-type Ser/Thr phosphatase [Pseudomonadota bacterium]
MTIRKAGDTNVGKKRNHNEDNFLVAHDQLLYIVADGMGGHAAGEVASKMAVETVSQFFKDTAEDDEITWPFKMDRQKKYEENRLVTAIKYANLRIYEEALANAKKKGMGTTVVAINFTKDGAYLGHVGDSRIYRMRQGELKLLTEDHSLLNDYIRMKVLSPEEIENFPHKNVIVRALGMKDNVQVDVSFEVPQHKDIYLLCTDGLSGEVTDAQMQQILRETGDDLPTGVQRLIQTACDNGGKDNVTCILTQYVAD